MYFIQIFHFFLSKAFIFITFSNLPLLLLIYSILFFVSWFIIFTRFSWIILSIWRYHCSCLLLYFILVIRLHFWFFFSLLRFWFFKEISLQKQSCFIICYWCKTTWCFLIFSSFPVLYYWLNSVLRLTVDVSRVGVDLHQHRNVRRVAAL